MPKYLSAGNNLSGNWYQETANKVLAASGYLAILTAQFTEAFTAPNTVNSAIGTAFMIDDTGAGGTSGTWTLTLQEDATGAFSGGESDVAFGTLDMDTYRLPDADGIAYIALTTPYQFTTTNAGAYRWKIQTSSGVNRLRQSSTSATNWGYICFDNRTAVPGANDTIFVADSGIEIDTSITLGNGIIGNGYIWTHAIYVLNGGSLGFTDDGNNYKLTLEGTVRIESGGQFGDGTAMIGGGTGTLEWNMGAYANGDFYFYIGRAGRINLVGVTRTINTIYASGAGTTASPLTTSTDIGLAVDDYIQVLCTEAFEETEYKYIKSGTHGTGWVLADTKGGAESGLSHTHTTEAPVLVMTRNLTITTTDSAKGIRIDDNKDNSITDGYSLGDDSIWSYVHIKNFYQFDMIDGIRTGMAYDTYTFATGDVSQNNKNGRTHQYNIYTNSTIQIHSLYHMYTVTAKNSTEQDSWYTVAGTNALSMAGGPMTFQNCTFWDLNYDNDNLAGGLGRCGTLLNTTFLECRVEAAQQVSTLNVRGNVTNIQLINCEFGTLIPSPITYNLFATNTYSQTILYKNCIFNDVSVGLTSELQGGLAGSFVKFHNYDQINNKHFVYENTGVHQSSGASLDDTITRTAGHLSYRFQSEDLSSGIYWDFFVPTPANSSVGVIGFALKNTAFFGDGSAELKMELFLPGETTPADTAIFNPLAANIWEIWSLAGNYTGIISNLSRVRITTKTITAGAYAYIADLWNGTNELTNLNTWEDALPATIMMQDFANPASVWNVLVSGNTGVGTFGDLEAARMFDNGIWLDVDNGTDSTDIPYGSRAFPCKTLSNAISIAVANNTVVINLAGILILDQNVSGYKFIYWKNGEIDLNSQPCFATTFRNLKVYGTQLSYALFYDCRIFNLQNLYGYYKDCIFFTSDILVLQAQQVHFDGCSSAIPSAHFVTLDCQNVGVELEIRNISAGVKIINYTSATNLCDIGFNSGLLWVDSTCTAGTIYGGGVFGLINDSGAGCTVDLTARAASWDALLSPHDIPGSAGRHLRNITNNRI